jgi:hypothetical protein
MPGRRLCRDWPAVYRCHQSRSQSRRLLQRCVHELSKSMQRPLHGLGILHSPLLPAVRPSQPVECVVCACLQCAPPAGTATCGDLYCANPRTGACSRMTEADGAASKMQTGVRCGDYRQCKAGFGCVDSVQLDQSSNNWYGPPQPAPSFLLLLTSSSAVALYCPSQACG